MGMAADLNQDLNYLRPMGGQVSEWYREREKNRLSTATPGNKTILQFPSYHDLNDH